MAGDKEAEGQMRKPEPARPGQAGSGQAGMMNFFVELAEKAFPKQEEEKKEEK